MKKTFTFYFILGTALLHAQPAVQWQNTIGGSLEDYCSSIQQTTDGGYILGGFSYSTLSGDKTENRIGASCYDYWIIKTDSLGIILWQNTIGGDDCDRLTSIQQTTDGGYILGGYSRSNISGDKTENSQGDYDFWIVKTDSIGNILWQNTIGGSTLDELISIQQTADGGYILGGHSLSNISGDKTENCIGTYDYWIVKTDSLGNIMWQNTIGGSESDQFLSIRQTTDGGYILGGHSRSNISGDKTENSNGGRDYWIIKTDASGNILWQNTIGGSMGDMLRSVQQTTDGGYIVGGSSSSPVSGDKTKDSIGWDDYWIVKTDSAGNILWQSTIGGTHWDKLESIHQTTDGGYILGGISLSNISGDKTENCIGGWDFWVVKTDSIGNILWQNTIGGDSDEGSNVTNQPLIELTSDGGYILGGFSESTISGDKTENSMGLFDYWIVKLAPDITTGLLNHTTDTEAYSLFPNPATNKIKVLSSTYKVQNVDIYDAIGKLIYSKMNHYQNTDEIIIDVSSLSEGIYFVRVNDGKNYSTKKLIIH